MARDAIKAWPISAAVDVTAFLPAPFIPVCACARVQPWPIVIARSVGVAVIQLRIIARKDLRARST